MMKMLVIMESIVRLEKREERESVLLGLGVVEELKIDINGANRREQYEEWKIAQDRLK